MTARKFIKSDDFNIGFRRVTVDHNDGSLAKSKSLFEQAGSAENVKLTTLACGSKSYPHLEIRDFPLDDPWSLHLRSVIYDLSLKKAFLGQQITEFGIGDGRNIRVAGPGIAQVFGIDIERWRTEIAAINLSRDDRPEQVNLWSGDAVNFLHSLSAKNRVVSGWSFICLPQSEEGLNAADCFCNLASLEPYKSEWSESALTLNAGVLDKLRTAADKNLRVLICLSDRVCEETKRGLFDKTGWQVEEVYASRNPVQQDPDTGIFWVKKIDDGMRFFEKTENQFRPISAAEAERRRLDYGSSAPDKEFNVYHGLTVYQLKLK